MLHVIMSMLLLVTLCQRLTADLADGLLTQLTLESSIPMILFSTILSGSIALLIKYIAAVRILPVYKLVTGSLLVLITSWYIDRICQNNAYLLVKSVGLAIIFCVVLGFAIVNEGRLAGNHHPQLKADAVVVADAGVMAEYSIGTD
jgi:hypothetical protein